MKQTEFDEIYKEYHSSLLLDRIWPTYLIPEKKLLSFIADSEAFILSGGTLTIEQNKHYKKFECILSRR